MGGRLLACLLLWALLLTQAPLHLWLQHGLVALIAFLSLLVIFAAGAMGGGDVKLGTAVFGWAGTQALWPAIFVIGVSGLVLALLGLAADCWTRRWPPTQGSTLHHLNSAVSARRGVPYGVALALGGVACLPGYW